MNQINYNGATGHVKTILPGSKSLSNRLLMLAAVGNFPPNFKNLSKCDDVQVLNRALNSNTNQLDVANNGTAFRFLTAFMSGIVGQWHLSGSERLKERPIQPLVDALKAMGAQIVYDSVMGHAPLTITGTKMKGGDVKIDISQSSQYASALLLIAPMFEQGLKLTLTGDKRSEPYIKLTIELMEHFGLKIVRMGDEISIFPRQEYVYKPYAVEGDWSSAAFWYQLVAMSPERHVKMLGLDAQSAQGDRLMYKMFEKLGVETQFGKQHVTLKNSGSKLKQNVKFDVKQMPDVFPSLAVACMARRVAFKITGTANLKLKESDRVLAILEIAQQMGVDMQTDADAVWVDSYPETFNEEVHVDVKDDHRIAMAAALLSVRLPKVFLSATDVVSKSYPEFWGEMARVGLKIAHL